jgi:WD40 repeat protein/serine/threonine protein kinase
MHDLDPAHPSAEELRAFSLGRVGEDDLARISAHLNDCSTCRGWVDGLFAQDALLSRLQAADRPGGGLREDASQRRQAAHALRQELLRQASSAELLAEEGAASLGATSAVAEPASTARSGGSSDGLAAGTVPAPVSPQGEVAQPSCPRQIGEYDILGEVGRGGMGVVYKARHRGLHRLAALKMVLAGTFASTQQRLRFLLEAELAARVQHPNIVQVYEIGSHEGQPFLAMEWVEGGSLAERLHGKPWPAAEAARLIETLAHAIHAAHNQGVIHRDLKPANVLLQKNLTLRRQDAKKEEEREDEGNRTGSSSSLCVLAPLREVLPKIVDFGLARPLQGDEGLTKSGVLVGTPAYMAPEQASGTNALVGPTTDVYALGVMLYQLLTGELPFQGDSALEVLHAVTSVEPVRPRRLQPGVPRDLEAVALKCLEKEPGRRYAMALELAEDLRRFLDHKPVQARGISAAGRLGRWARRNRGVAAALGVIALLLIGVAIVSSLAALRFERLAAEADRRGEAERWQRYRANMTAAAVALQVPNTGAARRALAAAPEEYRGWEWLHFNTRLDDARAILRMPGVPDAVTFRPPVIPLRPALAFSPDGKRIAAGSLEPGTVVWDTATGREAGVLPGQHHSFQDMAFGPDGHLLVFTADRTLLAWDLSRNDWTILCRIAEKSLLGLLLSPDGRLLLGVKDKQAQLWDVPAGRKRADLPGEFLMGQCMAVFSGDGRHLAYSTGDGAVHLWDVQAGAQACVLRGPRVHVRALAFSPDGKRLAAGADHPENTVRLWSVPAGEEVAVLRGHQNEVSTVAFNADGSRLASGSLDKTARLWDVSAGTLVPVLKGHTGIVRQTAFSPDGKHLATASDDETVRLWDAANGEPVAVLRGHTGAVSAAVFSPDGTLLASSSADATVRLWDVGQLESNGVLRGHTRFVYDVAFSPDGKRAVSAAWDGTARLWDPNTGREIRPPFQPATGQFDWRDPIVSAACFSPDGRQVATVTGSGAVTVWDVATGKKVRTLRVPAGDWRGYPRAAFQPSGNYLAVGAGDGAVRLWDAAGEEPVAVLRGHEEPVLDVAFSPDGAQLASAGVDRTVRLWDVETRSLLAVLRGHEDWVYGLAYSPDGRLLASASRDKTVRLWDTATHEALAILPHGSAVYGVAFSPDGRRLAAGCADNGIRLWDVASARRAGGKELLEAEVAELRGHEDYVHAVAWSPDGTRLISASGDRTVRVWDSLSARERAKRGAR